MNTRAQKVYNAFYDQDPENKGVARGIAGSLRLLVEDILPQEYINTVHNSVSVAWRNEILRVCDELEHDDFYVKLAEAMLESK